VLGILREILDVNDPPAFDRPARDAAAPGPNRENTQDRVKLGATNVVMRSDMDQLPVEAEHQSIHRSTESRRARGDGFECRLDIGRRAADDLEDLRGGRLL